MTKLTERDKASCDRPVLEIEITDEMIDAGIRALAEFEADDGVSLADRVSEIFLQMYFEIPSINRFHN